MELILSMDRISCFADELIRLRDTGEFSAARLRFTENELTIIPMAEPITIVLRKAEEE